MRCLSVSLIAMVTVAVAGCGGGSSGDAASTSAERLAVRGDMTRVCPDKRSHSIPMKVTNQLDTPVQFYFSEIDCFDWGGTTPAASSGMILPAGNAHSVLMEPYTDGESSAWLTTIRDPASGSNLASFRQNFARARGDTQTGPGSYRIAAPRSRFPIPKANGREAVAYMSDRYSLVVAYADQVKP